MLDDWEILERTIKNASTTAPCWRSRATRMTTPRYRRMVYVVFLALTAGLGFTRQMRWIADLSVRKRFVDPLHEDIGVSSIVIIFPIFRNTAITGLTLIDGKTTATSGRRATP